MKCPDCGNIKQFVFDVSLNRGVTINQGDYEDQEGIDITDRVEETMFVDLEEYWPICGQIVCDRCDFKAPPEESLWGKLPTGPNYVVEKKRYKP